MIKFNRVKLKKLIQEGKVTCISSRHYDDMYGETYTQKEMLVNFGNYGSYKEGIITIAESDLKTKSGFAYQGEPGHINLIVHGNLSYHLKINP